MNTNHLHADKGVQAPDSDRIMSVEEVAAWRKTIMNAQIGGEVGIKNESSLSNCDLDDSDESDTDMEDIRKEDVIPRPLKRFRKRSSSSKSSDFSLFTKHLQQQNETPLNRMPEHIVRSTGTNYFQRSQSIDGKSHKSKRLSLQSTPESSQIDKFVSGSEADSGTDLGDTLIHTSLKRRLSRSNLARQSWDAAASKIKSIVPVQLTNRRRSSLLEFLSGGSTPEVHSFQDLLKLGSEDLSSENIHLVFLHHLSQSVECTDESRLTHILRLISMSNFCTCAIDPKQCSRYVYYHLERRGLHNLLCERSTDKRLQHKLFELAMVIDSNKGQFCKQLRRKSKVDELTSRILSKLNGLGSEVTKESIEIIFQRLVGIDSIVDASSDERSPEVTTIEFVFSQNIEQYWLFPLALCATKMVRDDNVVHQSCRALCTLVIANFTNKKNLYERYFEQTYAECVPLIVMTNSMDRNRKMSFSYSMNILSEVLVTQVLMEKKKKIVRKCILDVLDLFFQTETKQDVAEDDIRVLFYSFIARFSSQKKSDLEFEHVFLKNHLMIFDILQRFVLYEEHSLHAIHTTNGTVLPDEFLVKFAIQYLKNLKNSPFMDHSAHLSKSNDDKVKVYMCKLETRLLFFTEVAKYFRLLQITPIPDDEVDTVIESLSILAEENWRNGLKLKSSNFLPSTKHAKYVQEGLHEFTSWYYKQLQSPVPKDLSDPSEISVSRSMVDQYLEKWNCSKPSS